jgi:outer membrane protein assembly factor BamB
VSFLALLVSPILSGDKTVLYQAGASTEMYAVDTAKGDVLWTSVGVGRGTVHAEPKLVELLPKTPKVYVIEGISGKVRQHDALTGTIDWTFDCSDVSGIACNDAVEADFRYDCLVEGN